LIEIQTSVQMKNAIQLSFLIIFFSLTGHFKTFAQERVNQHLSGFTSIQVSSGVDIYLTQGNSESVEIEAKEEVFRHLVAEVDKDKTLIIKLDPTMKRKGLQTKPVKAYVSFRDLNAIQLSGGSDLYGKGKMEFNHLNLSASGGSDARMSLQANELKARCSGGADLYLDGYVAYFEGRASGGADIKAKDLESDIAEISVSGGSDAQVKVKRELTASASGGSDITYYGHPEKVNSSKSGGSDIRGR
jgi:hypothetical protein